MPDDHFRRRFPLSNETVWLLCEELAGELEAERATRLWVERRCCARCTLPPGASVRRERGDDRDEMIGCRSRLGARVRNKCDHFPKTTEERAAVKEGSLRRDSIPGVIGCTDGSLIAIIAPKGERNAAFMCRKGYYAENCMFVSDSGYPLDLWLLTPVPGHPPMPTAEGKYSTAHAAMRSVVERRNGLLMSQFPLSAAVPQPPLRAGTCGQHCRVMCCVAQPPSAV
ncbi:hypothetical protein HPB49_026289 [Dermacentor silvarum]|nr:hypothetical protein HPB49_026289 [Dermacentor silvarum]